VPPLLVVVTATAAHLMLPTLCSCSDWSLAACSAPLSLVFVLQGIAAAVGGKWQMRVGHRAAMLASAACFGGGLMLAGAGIASHQLWMLYLGYVRHWGPPLRPA